MRRPPAIRRRWPLVPRAGALALAGALASGLTPVAAAADAASAPPVAAAPAERSTERTNLRLEIGAEYDSNVHRTERLAADAPAETASALGRAVLGWSAADRIGDRQDIAFSLLGAGKLFAAPAARSENVAVIETGALWRLALGDSRRFQLALAGDYYEVLQAGSEAERQLRYGRDFRSLTGMARATLLVGEHGALSLGAGYRSFVYKPLRAYDFDAPIASLRYQWSRETTDGDAEWEVAASGAVELRRFAGPRLVASPAGCAPAACVAAVDPDGARHQDQFFMGQLELTRTGALLAGVGYGAQWNRSNSYSESVTRHIATARVAAPLFLGLYLAARAEVVLAFYRDPVTVAVGPAGRPSATIEEENRNFVRAELSRDVATGVQIVARAVYYVNALFDSSPGYRRLTTTLALTASF